MQPQPLIHAVVQQTMVLVAHLATAGGVRAPVARIANQVFADLTAQLSAQGVAKSVIADMFGMALSTYHRRVRAAAASRTDVGRSVWEAILEFIRVNEPTSATAILARFARDDPAVVASVLRDLTDSGLAYRAGRGRQAVYRVANPSDFTGAGGDGRPDALRHIVWLSILRLGPITLDALSEELQQPLKTCEGLAEALVSAGVVECRRTGAHTTYESTRFDVPVGTSDGWEAAVLDHFQAVVTALCVKLRLGSSRSAESDAVGGSTFTLDVWPGHPLEEEAGGTLARLRATVGELRERIDAHNVTLGRPRDGEDREVTVYLGQYVKTHDADLEDGAEDDV